jgi:hypothetical protein
VAAVPDTPAGMKAFPVVLILTLLGLHLQAADKPKAAKGKLTSIQGIGETTETKLTSARVTSV